MPNTNGAVEIGRPLPPMSPPRGARRPAPGSKATFESLTENERETLAAMAEANGVASTAQDVEAMFLVIIPKNGTAVALSDVAEAAKYAGRSATVEEMRVACDLITRDIDQSRQAQITITQQMQMAAAMQRQAEDAELKRQLGV